MLRIAVNTRLLLRHNMEGIGWYTYEIFSRVVAQHPEVTFYFIFDRPFDKRFIFGSNVIPAVISPPVRHPILARIWFDFKLRRYLKKLKPDVFFSPDAQNSLKPVCKTITVIHDINFEEFPELISPVWRNYYRRRTPVIVDKSDRVVTVSEYSKYALKTIYKAPDSKVSVVYNAAGDRFQPIAEAIQEDTRRRYSQGKPYFVFVGGLYKRKNLLNLVKAFEIFKRKGQLPHKLLLVGQILPDAREVQDFCMSSEYREDMIFTGRIDDDQEVVRLLGSAEALTYVSALEGFGLPLVEAMKCHVPIITSNSSCLPEIAGKAALYVNPFEPVDIADKMHQLVSDPSLRQILISAAREQQVRFDWDQSAAQTWDIIEEVIQTS